MDNNTTTLAPSINLAPGPDPAVTHAQNREEPKYRPISIRHQVPPTIPAEVVEDYFVSKNSAGINRTLYNITEHLETQHDVTGNTSESDTDVTGNASESDTDVTGNASADLEYIRLQYGNDGNDDDMVMGQVDDLEQVKVTAQKLKLQTRRPSYFEWQKEVENNSHPGAITMATAPTTTIIKPFGERKKEIYSSIAWIKQELTEMQSHDYTLARKLMRIRAEMHMMQIRKWTQEHREMLEEAENSARNHQDELDELYELHCDEPVRSSRGRDILRHIGLTNMNFNARRYSIM